MSKIFRISGNFTENGKWAEPDPAFAGEIVVDKEGRFCGYCDELYGDEGGRYTGDNYALNKVRYLVGSVAEKNDGYGVRFYKLSNDPWQAPLIYNQHHAENEGFWGALTVLNLPIGDFTYMGEARISLEELPYTEEDADRIKARFGELDISVNDDLNGQMVIRASRWKLPLEGLIWE